MAVVVVPGRMLATRVVAVVEVRPRRVRPPPVLRVVLVAARGAATLRLRVVVRVVLRVL